MVWGKMIMASRRPDAWRADQEPSPHLGGRRSSTRLAPASGWARARAVPRFLLSPSLVLVLALAACGAEDVLETPALTNVRRQGWIQVKVTSGRLVFSGSRGVNFSHTAPTVNDRREKLSIRVTGQNPVLGYEFSNATQQFSLDASAGNRVQIRRLPRGDRAEPVPVEFLQVPGEPIVLKVGAKEQEKVYRAAGLWHLFLAEPAACRAHLAPLLRILLREWDFIKAGEEIEAILIRTAESGKPPDQQRWAEWVRQLGAPSFARREAADRQLREAGRVVVTYLEQLDAARLDAEQRWRVRRILQALGESASDESPAQTATWLSGDPAVWLALLARDQESTRRAAYKRLQATVGGPLEFDPGADPATRNRQLEALRQRILPK